MTQSWVSRPGRLATTMATTVFVQFGLGWRYSEGMCVTGDRLPATIATMVVPAVECHPVTASFTGHSDVAPVTVVRVDSPTLVLLPSPLLGQAVWEPVAAELADRGYPVQTVSAPQTSPRTSDDVMDHLLSAIPQDGEVILLPHSNAGLYVPALIGQRHVVGAVFVDAGLPPKTDAVPLAPPDLVATLAHKTDGDGLLPPWTAWWDEADVAELFPNPAVRARIEREQPQLPLSYFSARLPVPSGWDTGLAGAYLAFGDTYGEDRDLAAVRGWPTTTLSGLHLHMLMDPIAVTRELQVLLMAIGFSHPTLSSARGSH